MFLATNGIVNSGGSSYSTRTQAFATATGITDVTILNALNTFDLGLISNSLDTKMTALYPFVGGTSTTHSYNFMNTAQYQLTYFGGITHSSTGFLPNGTTGYAKTGIKPNSVWTAGDLGATFYSRTNRVKDYGIPYGCYTSGGDQFIMFQRFTGDISQIRCGTTGNTGTNISVTNSTGIFTMTRTDATNQYLYRNGSQIGTGSLASTSLHTIEMYIGNANEGGTPSSFYDNEELGIMIFHKGLNSTQVSNLYILINTLQTTLGR